VRIAFATTVPAVIGHDDVDRPFHEAAFGRLGMELDHRVWWEPTAAWEQYDLVVIRSTWDYVPRVAEYRRWLASMERLGTLRNSAALVAWNLDKRYLSELASAGLPVIPTRIACSSEELSDCLDVVGEVVVKPVVSAGSLDTGRFAADDPHALQLGQRILARGAPVMVQPAVPSVAVEGEISAVLFRGRLSHSFRKGPMLALGGGGLDGYELLEPVPLTPERERLVGLAADTVHRIGVRDLGMSGPPLYARVDLVRMEDGRDVVLEVELNEPSFFLPTDPGAADRFAAAVRFEVMCSPHR
jgi:glutathione synthase/RimK-type ligase-like ATP-grasp enzyme